MQTGTYPVTSAIAQFYGAQALKPEKSDNYGIGLVIDPTENLTLTADLYRIDVSDRIYISQTFHVTAEDIAALPELASVGVGGDVQYFTNSLDTKTTGVDLIGTWRSELGAGGLNLTLAYNYNKNEVTKFDPAAIGPAQIMTAERLAPNHRANLQAGWTVGDWASTWSSATTAPGAPRATTPARSSAQSSRPTWISATRSRRSTR